MREGLLPLAALAAAVLAALWGLWAQDPYWRLVETPDIPAPPYEPPQDLQAALDAGTLPLGNIDTGAESPRTLPLVATLGPDPQAGIAHGPDDASADSAEPGAAPEPVLSTTAGPDGSAPDQVTAVPVPLPAPMALSEADATAGDQPVAVAALDPFAAPATPLQPRLAADESTEDALALDRARRIDIQRRLALAGFDPKGFDGVFGPQTRSAIADFQAAWNFPVTGYLDSVVNADLDQRTADAYEALRRRAAAAPAAAPDLAPPPRERQLAAKDDDVCARRSDGQIIARQNLVCDIAGLAEKFVSLGRNSLDQVDDVDGRQAADWPSSPALAGVER